MNVATITISREEALRKAKAYLADKHADTRQVYQQLARAYEKLAEGTTLIDLDATIRNGGFDEKMRPRLAVAPADRNEVRFLWRPHETWATFDAHKGPLYSPRLERRVELQQLHGRRVAMSDGSSYASQIEAYALVPLVPADVRPATGQLRQWHARPKHLTPPRDPLLLSHLGGSLYAVLAQWDLTDLERAVLSGAMGQR